MCLIETYFIKKANKITTWMRREKNGHNDIVLQGFQTHVLVLVSVVVNTQYYSGSWPELFFVFQKTIVISL